MSCNEGPSKAATDKYTLVAVTILLFSSAELSKSGTERMNVMGLSECCELLDPTLEDHGDEGLKDAGKDVVKIADYGVQDGWENDSRETFRRVGAHGGTGNFTE